MRIDTEQCRDYATSSRLEWMLANGIGGYAMGSVCGANQRKYHGHLIAPLSPPTRRTLLLSNLEASVESDGRNVPLSTNSYSGAVFPEGYKGLVGFTATESVVEWRHECGVVKRLGVREGKNVCDVEYINESAGPIRLTLRPLVAHRSHHETFQVRDFYPSDIRYESSTTLVVASDTVLALSHPEAHRIATSGWYYRFLYGRERERGLDAEEDLFCPCELQFVLSPGQSALFSAALGNPMPPEAPVGESDNEPLISACERHLVRTEERSTIIAGYPWFTDWGRDTMVCLQGLLLREEWRGVTVEILRSHAQHLYKGLIPNRFPEEGQEPEYNTADATLWFVDALYQCADSTTAGEFLAIADNVLGHHIEGTLHGIGMDPVDGLLQQGESGLQLTWMDAKVDSWVVTPRHGKPVEINGLWINALRATAELANSQGDNRERYLAIADQAERSFEHKFWNERLGHYLDTVEPDDASLRPNQVIALSLPFLQADPEHAQRALQRVDEQLLTPFGLRTLSPQNAAYRGRFEGGMRDRDAAYHQGTVWPWLLGPYVAASLRYRGDREWLAKLVEGALAAGEEYGLGGIAEVYDGDPPHRPGGCPWQAWSAFELLRAHLLTRDHGN